MTAKRKAASQSNPAAAVRGADDAQNLKSLGKYQIKKRIGAGGMGAVYLALDSDLKRTVALKVLPREKADNATLVKRFKAEAQAAAHLKHDNIVTIYEAGQSDGYLFIALEYIEGTDVYNLIAKRGPLPVKRSLDIIKQVARALQHVHEQGMVHRDIKPSNLLIRRDGSIKLADLGLARSVDEATETSITRAGTTVGTVDYMAPEQARHSKSADIRSDIYSLGCTWYQMLTGSLPYPDGSLTNKLRAHATDPPPDPRQVNQSIPDGLVAVLHRMMAKSPQDRYQSPAELLEDLENANLSREAVANNVLAALADEEGTSPRRRTSEARGRPSLPPKARSGDVEAPVLVDVDYEPLKYVVLIAAAASLVALLWWIAAQFGSALDSPGPPDNRNPFQAEMLEGEVVAGRHTSKPGAGGAMESGLDGTELAHAADPANAAFPEIRDGVPNAEPTGEEGSEDAAGRDPPNFAQFDPSAAQPDAGGSQKSAIPADDDHDTATPEFLPLTRDGERSHLPEWLDDPEFAFLSQNSSAGDSPASAAGTPLAVDESASTDSGSPQTSTGASRSPNSDDSSRSQSAAGGSREVTNKAGTLSIESVAPSGQLPSRSTDRPTNAQRTGKGSSGVPRFAKLEAALRKLPARGGTIELAGNGPFFIGPIQLRNLSVVGLAAAPGSRPVVIFEPGETPSDALLHLTNGALTLRGIHFVVVGDRFPETTPLAIAAVTAGDLAIRDCTFTLAGVRPGPTTAVAVDGVVVGPSAPGGRASHVLLNRVFTRGDGLTAMTLNQPAADVLVSNCLFASGDAPAVVLTGTRRAGTESSERIVRFVSTTAVARKNLVELSSGLQGADPPVTRVISVNSTFATGADASESTFVVVDGWPENPRRSRDRSRFKDVEWETQSSLYLGWRNLLQASASGSNPVSTATDWQQVWNQADLDEAQFQPLVWPQASISDFTALQPSLFDTATIDGPPVRATDGGAPGCLVGLLPRVDLPRIEQEPTPPRRPTPPPQIVDVESPVHTLRIDLTRQNLGAVLAQSDWPSGTLVIASGFGNRTSSPIRVSGKSLRIEFVQRRGAALVLSPEYRELPSVESGEDVYQAFISVQDGTIELVNGRFRLPATKRQALPQWFLHADDGSFSLRNCQVFGPMLDSANYRGLIGWQQQASSPATAAADRKSRQYALVADSFLATYGPLMEAQPVGRDIMLQNSVLVSLDDLFDFDLSGGDAQVDAAFEARRCTFSAARSFFTVRTSDTGAPTSSPLALFVEENVFAGPADSGSDRNAARLLTCIGPVRAQKRLDWWERSNGYAPEITVFLHDGGDAEPAGAQDFDRDWIQVWGADRVTRPLTGSGGVRLTERLPEKTKLVPASFELDAKSTAQRWAEDGSPIGADISQFGSSPRARTADPPDSSKTRTGQPAKSRPAF
jgi:eukaryotic-like serine/threonine-protein kinase